MNQRRLRVFELRGYVSGQPEVWVLIDRAGDKAGYIRDGTEDLRERVGEGWGGLNSGEVDFPYVISGRIDQQSSAVCGGCVRLRVIETEGRFGL